jgi:hypothetical protein
MAYRVRGYILAIMISLVIWGTAIWLALSIPPW